MCYFSAVIDLHQGMTGEELRDVKPGLGGVAMSQLEVMAALARGNWKDAARKQAGTWVLLARTVAGRLKAKRQRA
jgi:hypothetical protein